MADEEDTSTLPVLSHLETFSIPSSHLSSFQVRIPAVKQSKSDRPPGVDCICGIDLLIANCLQCELCHLWSHRFCSGIGTPAFERVGKATGFSIRCLDGTSGKQAFIDRARSRNSATQLALSRFRFVTDGFSLCFGLAQVKKTNVVFVCWKCAERPQSWLEWNETVVGRRTAFRREHVFHRLRMEAGEAEVNRLEVHLGFDETTTVAENVNVVGSSPGD